MTRSQAKEKLKEIIPTIPATHSMDAAIDIILLALDGALAFEQELAQFSGTAHAVARVRQSSE
jgi:hypothetical protein